MGVKTISGFLRRLQHLPPEQMEDLGRGRWRGDLQILFSAEREKPLDPGAGMLGAVPFVAVGQEQDEAGSLPHLLSPDAMNWSMITWAPLAKSPNWASQIVRPSRAVTL